MEKNTARMMGYVIRGNFIGTVGGLMNQIEDFNFYGMFEGARYAAASLED